jgi:anaerobic selenocysteine-containing dehydrogenase
MARLGEVLLDERLSPPIDTLIVHNSNPAVILPDQERVIEGLARENLMTVVLEQFMTDTARYADIILPVTTQIEHLDLGIAWGHLYLSLNQPAIAPCGQTRPNSVIFRQLAAAVGISDDLLSCSDEDLIRTLLSSGHDLLTGIDYDVLEREGWARLHIADDYRPYVDADGPAHTDRLTLMSADVEFGAETPGSSLSTRYPLTLITRKQHIAFLNANYGGFPAHHPSPGEPLLQMHPVDAQARNIANDSIVRIRNDRGTVTMHVTVTDEVLPGVVAAPFGWWHDSSPEHRSINVLTNATLPRSGVGSAAFHETLVEVEVAQAFG